MDAVQQWIQQLEQSGKTPQEIQVMLYALRNTSAAALNVAILSCFTDAEKAEIEVIVDESQAEQRMQELFQQHIGVTVDQFVQDLQQKFMDGSLKSSVPQA